MSGAWPFDPENNLEDFIRLVHPNRKISKMYKEVINSLDCCTYPCDPIPSTPKAYGKKKDNDMRTYSEISVAEQSDLAKSRDYLISRMQSEYWVKAEESSQFFTGEPEISNKEKMKRIKEGKFIWTKEAEKLGDDEDYRCWADYVSFRDTAPDYQAHQYAVIKIGAAKQDALDVINTSPEVDGLAALKAFKSATFH